MGSRGSDCCRVGKLMLLPVKAKIFLNIVRGFTGIHAMACIAALTTAATVATVTSMVSTSAATLSPASVSPSSAVPSAAVTAAYTAAGAAGTAAATTATVETSASIVTPVDAGLLTGCTYSIENNL